MWSTKVYLTILEAILYVVDVVVVAVVVVAVVIVIVIVVVVRNPT